MIKYMIGVGTEKATTLLLTICLTLCFITTKSQVNPPGKRIQNVYFHGTWVGDYDDYYEAVFKLKQNGSKVEVERKDGEKFQGQIENGVLIVFGTKVIENFGTSATYYEFRLLNDGYTMECKYSTNGNFVNLKTVKLSLRNYKRSIQNDNDQDRVSNEYDKCPNTPRGLTINNGGVDLMGCQVSQSQQDNTSSTKDPDESSSTNSQEFPGSYQVQPNEEESKAIKILSNFMEDNLYSADIETDDMKMINKGYTVYKSGMKSIRRPARPVLVVKSGKTYYNEDNQRIVVPKKPGTKAELRYGDGSVLNLLPGAKIKIYGDDGLFIERKGVQVSVKKRGKEFLVITPTCAVGVRGTQFDIGYFNGATKIKLYEGSVSIFNEKYSIMLSPNEQVEIGSKTAPIVKRKIENKKSPKPITGKIPYTLPNASWVKQNTIDGYYTTAMSSSGKEEVVFVTGSISSSQYTPNVHRIHYQQKSRESHGMGSDANSIYSLDRKHIWICGKRGGIAFNEAGAMEAYWKKQNSGTTLDLNDIYFIDEQNGWCVGNNGTVLYTKNGGNTWNQKTGFIRKHLVGVQFVDKNNGWILCNGTYYPSEMPLIYCTTDGGNTWQATEVAAGLTNSRMDINAMWFIDRNNGWIVGENNLIMFTKDGGVSWDYYQKAQQGGLALYDIQFTDPWNGWICGEKGLIMHTVDGGKSWKKVPINETGTFTSLHFNGPYLGWVTTTKQIYQFKDENLFNQYRAKVLKGEWDTWSNNSKTNENTANPHDQHQEPKVDKPKTDKTGAKQNTTANIWHTQKFSNNMQILKDQVTTKANNGFVPVGLNCVGSQYEILFLGGNFLNISSWNMEWYNDANTLQEGINRNMNDGYLPTGFSWSGESYYVFYIKTNITGKAWQIVPAALDLNEVSKAIQPFIEQNYMPFGITIFGDEYYTLLVQTSEPIASSWQIQGYKDNPTEIAKGVNSKILEAIMPWGMLKSGGVANILYVGF